MERKDSLYLAEMVNTEQIRAIEERGKFIEKCPDYISVLEEAVMLMRELSGKEIEKELICPICQANFSLNEEIILIEKGKRVFKVLAELDFSGKKIELEYEEERGEREIIEEYECNRCGYKIGQFLKIKKLI